MRIAITKVLLLFSACCFAQKITVSNPSAIKRGPETVSISFDKLDPKIKAAKKVQVRNLQSGKVSTTQWIDMNSDGKPEELIFQVSLDPNQKQNYIFEKASALKNTSEVTTYSRFVPERIDDYAWENDRVAFRTYGPTAQQLVDDKKPGGTLSSGMDCWLKRVSYPIIDKWYKKSTEGGSYHKDSGEGLDNYHVGASRGCGGIGVWSNDSLYVSKNFVSYKTIANGPIRTIFELTYAPWVANGITIIEKKIISLDLGSQLTRYEVHTQTSGTLSNITAGITLHDKKGETKVNVSQGWFSYWEPLDDSELGTGIVVDPSIVISHNDYRTSRKDLSQLYVIMKPDNKIVYYAGFGWKKAGFSSQKEWLEYLDHFAIQLRSPLKVVVTP